MYIVIRKEGKKEGTREKISRARVRENVHFISCTLENLEIEIVFTRN